MIQLTPGKQFHLKHQGLISHGLTGFIRTDFIRVAIASLILGNVRDSHSSPASAVRLKRYATLLPMIHEHTADRELATARPLVHRLVRDERASSERAPSCAAAGLTLNHADRISAG